MVITTTQNHLFKPVFWPSMVVFLLQSCLFATTQRELDTLLNQFFYEGVVVDHYQILGIERGTFDRLPPALQLEEIKAQYRKLAMKYHPDRNPNDPEVKEKFGRTQRAYEILKDVKKRKNYDLIKSEIESFASPRPTGGPRKPAVDPDGAETYGQWKPQQHDAGEFWSSQDWKKPPGGQPFRRATAADLNQTATQRRSNRGNPIDLVDPRVKHGRFFPNYYHALRISSLSLRRDIERAYQSTQSQLKREITSASLSEASILEGRLELVERAFEVLFDPVLRDLYHQEAEKITVNKGGQVIRFSDILSQYEPPPAPSPKKQPGKTCNNLGGRLKRFLGKLF